MFVAPERHAAREPDKKPQYAVACRSVSRETPAVFFDNRKETRNHAREQRDLLPKQRVG
jgi:hypothetical protein